MKKSDIIDLILKIFGIYVIILALLNFKDLHYLRSLFSMNDTFSFDILSLVLFFGGGLITFLIGYFLVFKSTDITKFIVKNDQDFNITFDSNYRDILNVSLVIIGILILIIRLPFMISTIYRFVSYLTGNMSHTYQFIEQDIVLIIHYVLGYFLITNSMRFTDWIIRINKKNF